VPSDIGEFGAAWDPELMKRIMGAFRPLTRVWHRTELGGIERVPSTGSLIVSNHSGGFVPMDIPIIAEAYFNHFGYDRPLYSLGHDVLFAGPQAALFTRAGLIRAGRANAIKALNSGAAVIVFPGGDYDAFRPSNAANRIDFDGRTGYVKTAVEAGVPIVPVVLAGGQQNQIYLTRGRRLGRRLGLKRMLRMDMVPLTAGFPFGVTPLPLNVPLPTKISGQVLEPIDISARFGGDPDVAAIDAYVRKVMQDALTRLAAARRFPVIG